VCADYFHKCGPRRIDTIGEIVLFVIIVTIDIICDHCSIAFHKYREHPRALKHVAVIVGACHAEERVANP
jgi:hypothetical protein